MKKEVPKDWKFVGSSAGRRRSLTLAQRVCEHNVPVLITGPSGVGKDVLANDIHRHSSRAEHPFVAVNCASLNPDLVDAELFGVAHGAYTGAVKRDGLFQAAHGGTLFLDEVGDLSIPTQTRLLRAIDNGKIRLVGNAVEQKVDVRIISATNKDLDRLIAREKFRFDLFSRLARFSITIPPIGIADIAALLPILSATLAEKHDLAPLSIDELAEVGVLCQRPWEGNVRDMQSALERYYILCNREDSVASNWNIAIGEGTLEAEPLPKIPETFNWTDKQSIGKVGQAFNDLVFIELCAHMAGDDPQRWGLYNDIAQVLDMTGAGVTARLRRLALVEAGTDRNVLSMKQLRLRSRELRQILAPYRTFLL